jgi:hypothetical protein
MKNDAEMENKGCGKRGVKDARRIWDYFVDVHGKRVFPEMSPKAMAECGYVDADGNPLRNGPRPSRIVA